MTQQRSHCWCQPHFTEEPLKGSEDAFQSIFLTLASFTLSWAGPSFHSVPGLLFVGLRTEQQTKQMEIPSLVMLIFSWGKQAINTQANKQEEFR